MSGLDGDETDSFDVLISDYENEDRVIWQKPEVVIDLLGDLSNKTVAPAMSSLGALRATSGTS